MFTKMCANNVEAYLLTRNQTRQLFIIAVARYQTPMGNT